MAEGSMENIYFSNMLAKSNMAAARNRYDHVSVMWSSML